MRKNRKTGGLTPSEYEDVNALSVLPLADQPCTHVHVASVVFEDGSMFKTFERCDAPPIENTLLVRRARRLWGELNRETPMMPEPDVWDIVRYTVNLRAVS